jgi:glyoxylase-like metal-dependent hydrolase (beta-lactamase superfamily II)
MVVRARTNSERDGKMQITFLASSSEMNCSLVEREGEAILIDAGIPLRDRRGRHPMPGLLTRLGELGVKPDKIKAVFVSHFHGDHAGHAGEISGGLHIPVYATSETIERGAENIVAKAETVETMPEEGFVEAGGFGVRTVPTYHTPGAVGFEISEVRGCYLTLFTDVPDITPDISTALSRSRFIALECNHSLEMLLHSDYADGLKERVRLTHSSNEAVAAYFRNRFHGADGLHSVALIHLSVRAQIPFLAEAMVTAALGRPEVKVFAVPANGTCGPFEV